MDCTTVEIEVRGIVQGVGFRPFIYRIASNLKLSGNIANTPSGVNIRVTGRTEDIACFIRKTEREAPPLARIWSLESRQVPLEGQADSVRIRASSRYGRVRTQISPDMATCRDCAAEIMDRDNRRFDYAFTNCTNCGPRYTIIEALPYGREKTSMKKFRMCPSVSMKVRHLVQ